MFAKSTARRLTRAIRPTTVAVAVEADTDTYSSRWPAKRPARTTIRQAAIRASQMGLTV